MRKLLASIETSAGEIGIVDFGIYVAATDLRYVWQLILSMLQWVKIRCFYVAGIRLSITAALLLS